MSVKPVLLYPDTRLKTVCTPVDLIDSVADVIQDMIDTMDACPPRTVGIAAPQIGHMVRVAVVHSERNPKYPGGNGLLILINPVIEVREGEKIFREGCLSLPDYTANVRRAAVITVSYQDEYGMKKTIVAEGFESVVVQHEIDHLDGLLFLDRVIDVNTDLFRRSRSNVRQ